MAEQEPMFADTSTPEAAAHVHDYGVFTKLIKWGALVALAVAFIVMLIL